MSARAGDVEKLLLRQGLAARGGFVFVSDEEAPVGLSGKPARSVILAGHGGAAYWPSFSRWLASHSFAPDNPLDRWSRLVLDGIAAETGARAVYPSDIPYLPFQQWAMRAEGLKPSPLGILMHSEYGLWHAYRGALLFDQELVFPPLEKPIHVCDECVEKPCLSTCPVNAFSATGYAVGTCRDHVAGPDGRRCGTAGCLARNACPYGIKYRYSAVQQAFHMAAFLKG